MLHEKILVSQILLTRLVKVWWNRAETRFKVQAHFSWNNFSKKICKNMFIKATKFSNQRCLPKRNTCFPKFLNNFAVFWRILPICNAKMEMELNKTDLKNSNKCKLVKIIYSIFVCFAFQIQSHLQIFIFIDSFYFDLWRCVFILFVTLNISILIGFGLN